MTDENLLKFTAFKSQIDPSFWQRLSELKLDVDKLNEKVHKIWGYYSNKKPEGQNQLFTVDASSFNEMPEENRLFGIGSIINKNTLDGFRNENKLNIIKEEGKIMMEIIKKEAIENPHLLSRFLIFCYANLKSYQYYYWFAFPAPIFLSCKNLESPKNIREYLKNDQLKILLNAYLSLLDSNNKGFFFVKLNEKELKIFTIKDGLKCLNAKKGEWILGFSDTSNTEYPSWPLRNFIAFLTYHCPNLIMNSLRIICLRLDFLEGQWTLNNSIVLTVKVDLRETAWKESESGDNWVGWEKNEKGKMGPRLSNLKQYMDPFHLAEIAVDLNLKLMKWQILPNLNLEIIKASKCLLIGAGTLGCSVARNLMSWGVRHITFVDCGSISYSNPTRQFLYKFEDIGKFKAETAAAALKEIFPGVVSSGFVFTIPMPGHPIGESLIEETKENVKKLEELIIKHDVIFLLMDSREGRWLPTLVGAAKEKLVINAALGFDSYLVMRHGLKTSLQQQQSLDAASKLLSGDKLGCYFCSDVTAPGNSLRGRTLDQQCTVTRPGISNIAGALAVELFVSILQHPQKNLAPAETDPEFSPTESLLGILPHSIRGFMSHYQTILPAIEAFSSCVACSFKVIDKYKKEGFDFIFKSIETKEYLEELCGLTDLQNDSLTNDVLECSDFDSDE